MCIRDSYISAIAEGRRAGEPPLLDGRKCQIHLKWSRQNDGSLKIELDRQTMATRAGDHGRECGCRFVNGDVRRLLYEEYPRSIVPGFAAEVPEWLILFEVPTGQI